MTAQANERGSGGEAVPVAMAKGDFDDSSRTTPPPLGPGARQFKDQGFAQEPLDERFRGVEHPFRDIPDDTELDSTQLFEHSGIDEVMERLDRELVALQQVKGRVREIAALLVVDRLRRSIGLEADPPTLHMCLTGNPGTGKTTIAMRMGEILHKLGYIRRNHLVSVTRDDLVGQYVGHTAPKTREVLKRAMGGVLFIDEAYHIYRVDNERDYGQETVEMLLQVMENERDHLVVIMAGYKDQMDRFFTDVPGLSSRIAHHIDFPDYDLDQLMEIAALMTDQQRYRLSSDATKVLQEYLKIRTTQPRFANGRSVRNALDRARLRQAVRLYDLGRAGKRLTKADLLTIDAEDIHQSRVFEGGAYASGETTSQLAVEDANASAGASPTERFG